MTNNKNLHNNNVNDLFDTYVLSLHKPTKLLSKLRKCNLHPILFPATNGKLLDHNTIQHYTTPLYSMFGPKSAIGCAISHISIWKKFLKSNKQYAIIFEDDIIFKQKNFKKKILFYLSNTPKDFDILYLGCFGSNPNNTFFNSIMTLLNKSNTFSQINKYIIKPKVALATHAYILSKSGAEKLVNLLQGQIHNHIDFCIQSLSKQNLINTYVTNPRLVYQTSTNNGVSQNISNSYPILFNHILSQFYVDHFVKASYITTLSIFRLHSFNVSISNILLLILLLFLYLSNTHIIFIIYFILIISLSDFIQIN